MSKSRLRTTGYLLIAIFFIFLAAFITPYYILYGPVPPAPPTVILDEEFDYYSYQGFNLEYEVNLTHPFIQLTVDLEITNNPAFLLQATMNVKNSTGDVILEVPIPGEDLYSTNWFCAQGEYNITINMFTIPNALSRFTGHLVVMKQGWPWVYWWSCPLYPT